MSSLLSNFWGSVEGIYTKYITSRPSIRSRPPELLLKDEIIYNKVNPMDDIFCEPIHSNNIFQWHAMITGPKHTPYCNGKYYLLVDIPSKYPSECPSIRFDTTKCSIAYVMDFQEKDIKNEDEPEKEQMDECGIIQTHDDEKEKQTKLLYLQEPEYVKNVMVQNIVDDVWTTEMTIQKLCNIIRGKIFNYDLRLRDKPLNHYKHFANDDIDDMNDKYVLDQLRMMCSYNNKHCDADGTPLKLLSYECYLKPIKSKWELFAHLNHTFRKYKPLVKYIGARNLQVFSSNQATKSSDNQPVLGTHF